MHMIFSVTSQNREVMQPDRMLHTPQGRGAQAEVYINRVLKYQHEKFLLTPKRIYHDRHTQITATLSAGAVSSCCSPYTPPVPVNMPKSATVALKESTFGFMLQ